MPRGAGGVKPEGGGPGGVATHLARPEILRRARAFNDEAGMEETR
jgi:hypothetical protein